MQPASAWSRGQGQSKMRQRRRKTRRGSRRRRGIKRSSERHCSRYKVVEAATQLNDALRHVGATLRMCVAAALSSLASHCPPSLPLFLSLSFLFSLSAFFCFFRRIHCTWAESASPFQFLLSTKRRGKGSKGGERSQTGSASLPAHVQVPSDQLHCIGCLCCPVSRVHVHVMDIACELANFAEFLCRILPLNEMESKWRQGRRKGKGSDTVTGTYTHNRGMGESSCKLC